MPNTKQDADKSFFVFVKNKNTNLVTRLAIPTDVQVGLLGNPAELQLLGRLSLAVVEKEAGTGTSNIAISSHDTVVCVNRVSAAVTQVNVFLPTNPRDGQLHFIKDSSGTAAVTPIVISAPNNKLIDQSSTVTISNSGDSLVLVWLKDSWHTIAAGAATAAVSAASSATYLTLAEETQLPASRRLSVSGSALVITDNGPAALHGGGAATLDLSTVLTGASVGTFTAATVTTDGYGRITAIASGTLSTGSFVNNGNSFAADASLGLNDNFDLTFLRNATEKLRLTGNVVRAKNAILELGSPAGAGATAAASQGAIRLQRAADINGRSSSDSFDYSLMSWDATANGGTLQIGTANSAAQHVRVSGDANCIFHVNMGGVINDFEIYDETGVSVTWIRGICFRDGAERRTGRNVTLGTSPYAPNITTDYRLKCQPSGTNGIIIRLPALGNGMDGQEYEIFDFGGLASTSGTILISPSGTDKIDGVNASYSVTTPYGGVKIAADISTSTWVVIFKKT